MVKDDSEESKTKKSKELPKRETRSTTTITKPPPAPGTRRAPTPTIPSKRAPTPTSLAPTTSLVPPKRAPTPTFPSKRAPTPTLSSSNSKKPAPIKTDSKPPVPKATKTNTKEKENEHEQEEDTKTNKTTLKKPNGTAKTETNKSTTKKLIDESKTSKRKSTEDSDSKTELKKQKPNTTTILTQNMLPTIPEPVMADIMTMGSGEVGQLGLGRKRPTPVPELQGVSVLRLIVGGLHNAVIVKNEEGNTSVWTWGCNDNHILGRSTPAQEDDDVDLSMVPDTVPLLEGKNVIDISTGEYQKISNRIDQKDMAALTASGNVYLWGNYKDQDGFLGYSGAQKTEQITPQRYPKLQGVKIRQIASGHNHTIALTATGKVLIWGFHWLGRRVSERMKRLYLDPQNVAFPKKNGKDIKIVKVSAGGYHSFAVTDEGAVYCWGLNNKGQLGINNTVDQGAPVEIERLRDKKINEIYGGLHHSVALCTDGKVFTFGRGDYGQLGNNSIEDSLVPVEVTFFNDLEDEVTQIATGDNHVTAVTSSGAVYAWGFGESSQIGNGDADSNGEDAIIPFKIVGPKLVTKVRAAGAGGQHTAFVVEAVNPN